MQFVSLSLHFSITKVGLDCLKAGVNVLIEKPIAANELEAKSLINASKISNCLLQVGHIERFNPAFRELNKIIQNEEIVVFSKQEGTVLMLTEQMMCQ